ncbi:MAG: SPOR domain-containing protein [Halioglobus sp.]
MNNILKQRLVGALILVALGVVFWPIIFVEPDDRSRDVSQRMPPPPVVDTTPIAPPDKAGLREAPLTDAQIESRELEQQGDDVDVAIAANEEVVEDDLEEAQSDSTSVNTDPASEVVIQTTPPADPQRGARSEAPVKPQLDAQGVPVAWILQVASVSDRTKANRLRDELLSLDEKAYIKQVKRGDETLYRIYVGPKFEQAKLDALKPKVDAQFKVKSMVVRYVP